MKKKRLLIVDGYNVLGAWKGVLSGRSLQDARDQLAGTLHDYAGSSGQRIVLVFDAWQSDRQERSVEENDLMSVVFTQRGETADHYIERLCDGLAREVQLGRLEVRVATSDGVEQTIVMGRGAARVSARELLFEVERARASAGAIARPANAKMGSVMDRLPEDVKKRLEEMRRK